MKNIILAPHADDELIGCWSLLNNRMIDAVVYFYDTTVSRKLEAYHCSGVFGFTPYFIKNMDDSSLEFLLNENKIYIPALTDSHPHHKYIHRKYRLHPNKEFYSVDLDYCKKRVLSESEREQKHADLNIIYTSQKKIWDNNASYYLFESISSGCNRLYTKEIVINANIFYIEADIEIGDINLMLSSIENMMSSIIDILVFRGCDRALVSCGDLIYTL